MRSYSLFVQLSENRNGHNNSTLHSDFEKIAVDIRNIGCYNSVTTENYHLLRVTEGSGPMKSDNLHIRLCKVPNPAVKPTDE